ncbi:hypothetical protein [Streptomyces sp. NPDC007355]|uniref:hypothetical protein n=1 Tax=Streptomyces sp. NPDC007355 TaxID=3364778 RepID=UPI0036C5BE93
MTATPSHFGSGRRSATLEATGLAEVYRAVAAERLGADRYARLVHEPREPDETMGGELREAARAVTYLRYTGNWPGTPHAYAEGLVWKAAGLRAPATDTQEYGSWAGGPARAPMGPRP